MTLHAVDVLGDAVSATRRFRPRGIREWAWVVSVAAVAGTAGIIVPTRLNEIVEEFTEYRGFSDTFGVAPLPVIGALVSAWIAVVLVGAFLEFPFLEWLRTGASDIMEVAGSHKRQALRLAAFRIGLGGATVAIVAGLVVARAGPGASGREYATVLSSLSYVVVLVVFATGVVRSFTTAFVVPTMLLEDRGVVGGWRRFWSTLTDAPKQFAGFVVGSMILAFIGRRIVGFLVAIPAIPAGFFSTLYGLAIIGYFPHRALGVAFIALLWLLVLVVYLVGTAILELVLRYYALFVLAAVDQELDAVPERRRTISEESPSQGEAQTGPDPGAGMK